MTKSKELPLVVYTPDSQMCTPFRLLLSMYLDFKNSRSLAWRLFVRDLSAKYRQSLLGIFWEFIPPIVVGLIFIVLQSRKIVNFGETDIPYPVYALIGTTLWQLFSESLNAPLISVKTAKPMLTKIKFPCEALPLSACCNILFKFLIKSVVLSGILLFFKVKLTLGLLLAPVAILMLILLGITIGLWLTPLGMLYNDIPTALPFLTQFFFFLTPVVYPPIKTFPFSLITTLNPISPVLSGARDLIAKGYMTNIQPFLVVSLLTLMAFLVALIAYRISLPIIIERMSA